MQDVESEAVGARGGEATRVQGASQGLQVSGAADSGPVITQGSIPIGTSQQAGAGHHVDGGSGDGPPPTSQSHGRKDEREWVIKHVSALGYRPW